MKKVFLLLLLLLMVGCSSSNSIKDLSYKELNKKLDNKESFVIMFNNNTDDDGSVMKNTLEKVLKDYELKGYELLTNKLSTEEINNLKMEINYDEPCIVFIIEGTDPTVLSHVTDTSISSEEIVARLKDMNFIKIDTSK